MERQIPMVEPLLLSSPGHETAEPASAVVEARASKDAEPRRGWRGHVLWALAVVVAFGVGWHFAGEAMAHRDKETLPPATETAQRDPAAVTVTAEPVAYHTVERTITGVGTLHGFEEVTISAKVEGRVRKVCHDVADRVRPGEVLLEIDPIDNDLAVQQAERSLQVELAKFGLTEKPGADFDLKTVPMVVQARARLENAKTKLARAEKLWSSKALSEEDLSNLRSEFGVAEAEFANQFLQARAGLATIQMKQAALAVAQQQLKETHICVPTPTIPVPGASAGISYAVTNRNAAEGNLVRPGTEVFRLVINQTLKLRVPVPERHSAEVKLGQSAAVSTAAFERPFTGTVTRINPAVEPTTRTFEVEIQVPNPHGELKPGSFAKAAILTRVDQDAATVPLAALVQFAGITKVFLLEQGRAKEVQVTPGAQTGAWVEIARPALPRGALVITSGQTMLAADTPVTVRVPAKQPGQ